ncbi:MAG: hypothetical protein MUC87_00370 [Bacteroidia bacterium]|jgi:hypothetical protein|nr:hypothetical protein [Bacteroidia bacterium]
MSKKKKNKSEESIDKQLELDFDNGNAIPTAKVISLAQRIKEEQRKQISTQVILKSKSF